MLQNNSFISIQFFNFLSETDSSAIQNLAQNIEIKFGIAIKPLFILNAVTSNLIGIVLGIKKKTQ